MAGSHVHALYHHGDSSLHRLAPQLKIAAAFGFVLAVVITPREAFWAFGLYLVTLIALAARAGLTAGFVFRRMVVEIPFLAVALLLPLLGSGERIEVMGLSLSVQGLWDLWNIAAKATLGLLTAIILAATTQVPDFLKGLEALRVPTVVTGILSFAVRYVDVIVGDFARMRIAMAARGYQPRWAAQWKPYAQTLGMMFVRTYERGERVYLAMASRGYDGTMPASLRISASRTQWLVAAAFVAAAWVVAILGWATR